MRESRANRLQKGALSWGLFHDVAEPERYLEYFVDEPGPIICGASTA